MVPMFFFFQFFIFIFLVFFKHLWADLTSLCDSRILHPFFCHINLYFPLYYCRVAFQNTSILQGKNHWQKHLRCLPARIDALLPQEPTCSDDFGFKLVKISCLDSDVKVCFFCLLFDKKASTGDIELDVSALLQQDYITWRKANCPVSSPLAHLPKPLTADVCIGNGPLLRTRTVADVAFCCRSFKVGWLKPTAPFDMIKIGFSESRNKKHQIFYHFVTSWLEKNMFCFRSFEANGRWCSAHRALQGGLRCLWEARLDGWLDDTQDDFGKFWKIKEHINEEYLKHLKTWTETLKLSIFSSRHYKVLKRVFQHESYVWALTVTPWCLGRNVAMSFKACHFVIGFCRTCKGHKTLGLAFGILWFFGRM